MRRLTRRIAVRTLSEALIPDYGRGFLFTNDAVH